jgi:hypothetical protein
MRKISVISESDGETDIFPISELSVDNWIFLQQQHFNFLFSLSYSNLFPGFFFFE